MEKLRLIRRLAADRGDGCPSVTSPACVVATPRAEAGSGRAAQNHHWQANIVVLGTSVAAARSQGKSSGCMPLFASPRMRAPPSRSR
jgi:hypothetical protein